MAMKLAFKLDSLLELPQFKDNQELTQLVIQHFQDALPKTYKGTARIRNPNNFIYPKGEKPKPKDINGRTLPPVKKPEIVAISELQEIKDENKQRRTKGTPLLDSKDKIRILKLKLKDPVFKQLFQTHYVAQYERLREQYRQAQLQNPCSTNQAYVLDPETLEYRQRKEHTDFDLSDNEECGVQGSDEE